MTAEDYWAIAEADIEIQNPITDRKLALLDAYCDLRDGMRVLDVGCGKAWLLRRWADTHSIEGTGLELNPAFVAHARAHPPAKGALTYVEGPAEAFAPAPASYDAVLCLGATVALGGFVQTVEWLVRAAKPGAAVVVGDLTLKHRPALNTHEHLPLEPADLAGVVQRHDADVAALISASDADFERYASHHRHATLRWAREHPDHPDREAVLERSLAEWTHYLKDVRPRLGWTIVVANRV